MLPARAIVRIAVGPAAAVILCANACGNGAVDVSGCRAVEEARCRQAPACGIALEPPYHSSGTSVDACIRYYEVACLHGLGVPDPGTGAINACAAAISAGDCTLVQSPETGACAWLAPSAASSSAVEPTDAAEDTDAVESTDAAGAGEAAEPTVAAEVSDAAEPTVAAEVSDAVADSEAADTGAAGGEAGGD
jgi:hypothetical protein